MGRPSKGDRALSRQVFLRLTPAHHEAFRAIGGPPWLRAQLEAEIQRQRLAPLPTAHNPLPHVMPAMCPCTSPDFTVTDAKTGEPIPHTVTIREY